MFLLKETKVQGVRYSYQEEIIASSSCIAEMPVRFVKNLIEDSHVINWKLQHHLVPQMMDHDQTILYGFERVQSLLEQEFIVKILIMELFKVVMDHIVETPWNPLELIQFMVINPFPIQLLPPLVHGWFR